MADVGRVPGVFEQVRLVAGLRWRILRNSLQRKNNRWDFIGMIWAAVFSALFVVGMCFAFYAGANAFLSTNRASWMGLLFWGIFLYWQLLPMFAAGFGANFEFRTLLRFPLSLQAFYLLGLGYGLADFAAVSAICWIVSMVLGAAGARRNALPALAVVSILFVLINVTLERLVGSWLERILAKRRTRELFLGLFVLSMVSLNFLTPLFERYGNSARPTFLGVLPYLAWLPGSLAGNAVAAAANAHPQTFLTSALGLLCWLGVTSGLLWLRFAAQYRGEELSESVAPAVVQKRQQRQSTRGEWPKFIRPEVVAVAVKEFRYLTRNGFAFLTLVLPPIMVLFFTMQFAGRNSPLKEHRITPEMFYPAIMAYLILILISPAYNSFAFESKGIQTYFMAPVRFQDVLMGKNLFLACLVGMELMLSLALLVWRIGWPSAHMLVATIAAGAFAVTGQLAIANWSSLTFPKKMEIGKMKGQRNSGVAVWTAFGVQILLGTICTVILLAGKWMGNPWIPAIAFAGLTGAAMGGYVSSLKALNGLAEEKKELLIETLCR
jgi:ABC-2 type transport system permease protein